MIYSEILSKHPDYIDAYLRLAMMALKRGDTGRAMQKIDQSLQSKQKQPIAQVLMKAKILMDLGND